MLNDTFMTSRLNAALGWARKFSIFQYPFVTACCGMEYMATACAHYDVDRFGAGLPRFSPRQADVLFVVGTISHKMAPVLKRIHEQMAELHVHGRFLRQLRDGDGYRHDHAGGRVHSRLPPAAGDGP